MTQEERWKAKYDEIMAFMAENRRNPSRKRLEEHAMLNWLKAKKKMMNARELIEERVERYKELCWH